MLSIITKPVSEGMLITSPKKRAFCYFTAPELDLRMLDFVALEAR